MSRFIDIGNEPGQTKCLREVAALPMSITGWAEVGQSESGWSTLIADGPDVAFVQQIVLLNLAGPKASCIEMGRSLDRCSMAEHTSSTRTDPRGNQGGIALRKRILSSGHWLIRIGLGPVAYQRGQGMHIALLLIFRLATLLPIERPRAGQAKQDQGSDFRH